MSRPVPDSICHKAACRPRAFRGTDAKEFPSMRTLRDVVCSAEWLDSEPGDLVVRAKQVAAESDRLLDDFRVQGGSRELLKGRLAVVIP
jgi:hypothetical protein